MLIYRPLFIIFGLSILFSACTPADRATQTQEAIPIEKPTPLPSPENQPLSTAGQTREENWSTECTAGDPGKNDGLTNHQVYRTSSTDGFTFERNDTLLIDAASVPDGVVGPDGQLWVYYVNGIPGQHGPFVAAEQIDGSFAPIDCVRIDGVFVGDAVDPDIMRLPDDTYRLFYFYGYFVRPPQPGKHAIHSALSTDGLNFTHEGIVFEYEGITDPTVIQLTDGSWLLAAARPHAHEVVIARSSDGRSFNYETTLTELSIPELAILDNDTIALYAGELLLSADQGRTWTVQPAGWVPGPDPSFVRHDNGEITMFYKRFGE